MTIYNGKFVDRTYTAPVWYTQFSNHILDFKLSPWFEYCTYSFGYFPGVKL